MVFAFIGSTYFCWKNTEISLEIICAIQNQGYQISGFHPETPSFGLNLRAQGLEKKLTNPE